MLMMSHLGIFWYYVSALYQSWIFFSSLFSFSKGGIHQYFKALTFLFKIFLIAFCSLLAIYWNNIFMHKSIFPFFFLFGVYWELSNSSNLNSIDYFFTLFFFHVTLTLATRGCILIVSWTCQLSSSLYAKIYTD